MPAAGGSEAVADVAALRNQPELLGQVASDPAAWRALKSTDAASVARLRGTRARARQLACAQHAETRGPLPPPTAASRVAPKLVLDIDATIVVCHSEKQDTTAPDPPHADVPGTPPRHRPAGSKHELTRFAKDGGSLGNSR